MIRKPSRYHDCSFLHSWLSPGLDAQVGSQEFAFVPFLNHFCIATALAGAAGTRDFMRDFGTGGKDKNTHPAAHHRLLAPLLRRTRSVDLSASNTSRDTLSGEGLRKQSRAVAEMDLSRVQTNKHGLGNGFRENKESMPRLLSADKTDFS